MPPEYGVCICRPYAGNSEHTSKSCYVHSVVQEEEHKNEQPSEVNYPFCPLGCKMSIHLQIYFVYVLQALCHFKLPNPVGGNLETHLLQKQQCIGHDQWNMFSHCELESEVLHISDRCSMARKHITTKLGEAGVHNSVLGDRMCCSTEVQLAGNFGTETRTVLSVDGKLTSYSLGLSMSFKGLNL